MQYTVGSYLAARFSQIGLKHHFAVAGDYNLALLDQLLTNKDLEANLLQQRVELRLQRRGLCPGAGCSSCRRHLQRRRALGIQCDRRRLCRESARHSGVRRTQQQ